ncbi:DUF4330 family protein [Haloarcula sp. GH36]|uniref:DUF4330 family protein n=1 Tax=Haloarcula montana TaxID=3111776 RepID=UPI002D7A2E58|nr:DUF4330 family protein [Haloarcula sp. GH36]
MAGSGRLGPVLDEDGSLFGIVNIVDALVVVLLVTVVVAGVALVISESPDRTDQSQPPRYATVTYTVPISSDAASIDESSTLTFAGSGSSYEVTTTTKGFTSDREVQIVARVRYRGNFSGPAIDEQGILRGERPLYGGDESIVLTRGYRTPVTVMAVNQSTSSIQTRRIPLVLAVNESVGRAVETGDSVRVGSQTVGTVRAVAPETEGSRALVGLELTAWLRDDTPWYTDRPLRVDTELTVVTNDAVITGRVTRIGTTNTTER